MRGLRGRQEARLHHNSVAEVAEVAAFGAILAGEEGEGEGVEGEVAEVVVVDEDEEEGEVGEETIKHCETTGLTLIEIRKEMCQRGLYVSPSKKRDLNSGM